MYQVHLLPLNIKFVVDDKQTLLEAALNAGVAFPHRCQVGVCAMCLCRMVEGEVFYQLEPMLTEDEIEQGWIVPCSAYAKSDLVLDLRG